MNLSIFILNWNGLDFLKECIPSVIVAVKEYPGNIELIVLDNGSNDKSVDYLKSNFRQVRVLESKINHNFTRAMNIGIKEARNPLVISLNNDLIVKNDFILPLTRHFADTDVFAVASKMLFRDGERLNFGRVIPDFRWGFFHRKISDTLGPVNTLYACAGAFAVDREKFIQLGGFDEDFPVYWEDADLCYRAWKCGWRTIYEPRSVIHHNCHGTNRNKYGLNGIDALSGRNYLLFVVKNFENKKILFLQVFFFPLLILFAFFKGKPYFVKGMLESLKEWKFLIKKRKDNKENRVLSDREIFQKVRYA